MRINIKDIKNDIRIFLLFLIYKILLEIVYINAVSYWYSYLGFKYNPDVSKAIISYVLYIVLFFVLPKKGTVDGRLINTFFTISIVPLLSFFWLSDMNFIFIIYASLFFVIFCFVSTRKGDSIKIKVIRSSGSYEMIITSIFMLYLVLCFVLGVMRGGMDARALSFDTIYSLRSDDVSSSTFEAYMSNWCTKAFFPMLCTYYLYTKKYIRVTLCFIAQVFMYLCYGYKAFLLSALLTIIVFFIGIRNYNKGKNISYDNIWMFIVGLIPCLLSKFNGILGVLGFEINNTFAMRMLFEPARVQRGYFEFFSVNPKMHFSEGIIGKILGLKYPYEDAIGFVITRYMNGSDAVSNSNTGIIADSYSQLGILGVISIAILAGLTLLIIKKLCINIPGFFVQAAFFYPVVMLNDNPLLTNILTNGWFWDIILIILFEGALQKKKINDN